MHEPHYVVGDNLQMPPDVCSSCKQIPEYFTDTPYKAGTYVYYTKITMAVY